MSLIKGDVTFTTGSLGCNYLGFCSIKYPSWPGAPNYQAAPSRTRPWMYAPFYAGPGTSSGVLKKVTFVWSDMLSSGRIFYLEVFCIIAVKKLIGLNKWEMHKDFGVTS